MLQQPSTHPSKISDYVLGLLPQTEQKHIEEHAATCQHCHAAIQQERQISQRVRDTIATMTQPAPQQLARLMPSPPIRRPRHAFAQEWQRGMAVAALLVFLLIGNFGYSQWSGSGTVLASPSPTSLAATATATAEPTAIHAQIAQSTAIAPSRPVIAPTPVVTIESYSVDR